MPPCGYDGACSLLTILFIMPVCSLAHATCNERGVAIERRMVIVLAGPKSTNFVGAQPFRHARPVGGVATILCFGQQPVSATDV